MHLREESSMIDFENLSFSPSSRLYNSMSTKPQLDPIPKYVQLFLSLPFVKMSYFLSFRVLFRSCFSALPNKTLKRLTRSTFSFPSSITTI